MQVVGIQPGAVDRVGRIGPISRAGSCGGDVRNRINKRLGGEAPDVAFEHGGVRRCIDFIDPPVIGLAEFEKAIRVIRRRNLARADQHAQRIGRIGIIDIIKDSAKVHIVRVGN